MIRYFNWAIGLVLGFFGGGIAGYRLAMQWFTNRPVPQYIGSYPAEDNQLGDVAEVIFLAIFGTFAGSSVCAVLGAILLHFIGVKMKAVERNAKNEPI